MTAFFDSSQEKTVKSLVIYLFISCYRQYRLLPEYAKSSLSQQTFAILVVNLFRYFSYPRPNTNLVHSKAVGKPLVAIILSILKCTFYGRTIKI